MRFNNVLPHTEYSAMWVMSQKNSRVRFGKKKRNQNLEICLLAKIFMAKAFAIICGVLMRVYDIFIYSFVVRIETPTLKNFVV